MEFRRGKQSCAEVGCNGTPVVSVMLVVATPGKKQVRTKKASRAIRLCMHDATALALGDMPESFQQAARDVLQIVTGEKMPTGAIPPGIHKVTKLVKP